MAAGMSSCLGRNILVGGVESMADGTTVPISQVQAGDEVLAFDALTGRNVPGRVVETFTHEDVALLEVRTSAGRVETTATHPFYVERASGMA